MIPRQRISTDAPTGNGKDREIKRSTAILISSAVVAVVATLPWARRWALSGTRLVLIRLSRAAQTHVSSHRSRHRDPCACIRRLDRLPHLPICASMVSLGRAERALRDFLDFMAVIRHVHDIVLSCYRSYLLISVSVGIGSRAARAKEIARWPTFHERHHCVL